MEDRQTARIHKISMIGRRSIQMTGVTDVVSFDVKEAILETTAGMVNLRGNELHVKNLNVEKGEMDIEGQIDELTYSEITSFKKKGESVLARMFR